tara:strand:- start:1279 stop:1704 length:426 start_codon:yes stop_codon:yes gene_type:complete
MPTIYGADAQITGSLEIDGDIILGTGDDEVILKGLAYSPETKTGPGDDGDTLNIYLPLTILNSSGGSMTVTLPDGTNDGQVKKFLVTGYLRPVAVTVTSASWQNTSQGTITFTYPATYVHLIWTNSAWWVVGSAPSGVAYA